MTTAVLPAFGLHPRVPFADYLAWDAVNQSSLWEMERSPAHYRAALERPDEPTDAMAIGSLLHAALFEPDKLGQYVVWAGGPRNRNPAKADWPIWQAEQIAAGRTIIEDGTAIAKAQGMAAALRANSKAAPFIDGPGDNELSMLWADADTGIICKGRLDRLAVVGGRRTIVELKTTNDARPWRFRKTVESFGYHMQAAAYTDGMRTLEGGFTDHVIVVVEQEPPHGVKVYLLGDATMQTGLLIWKRCLAELNRCRTTGVWPAYPDRVEVLDIGQYAIEEGIR